MMWSKGNDLFIPTAKGDLSILRKVSLPSQKERKQLSKSVEALNTTDKESKVLALPQLKEAKSAEINNGLDDADLEALLVGEGMPVTALVSQKECADAKPSTVGEEGVIVAESTNRSALDDDGDDDNDGIQFSQQTKKPSNNPFIEDEADVESDPGSPTSSPSKPISSKDITATQADDSEDEGSPTRDDNDDEVDGGDMDDEDSLPAAPYMTQLELPKPQPAFLPSSSPLELTHRFLCWNHLGSITLHRGERGTVDIHFTNAAKRRPISFTDTLGFLMGSLGEDGAIFCTDLYQNDDEDDENEDLAAVGRLTKAAIKKNKSVATGSTLYFNRFETISSIRDKDWYLTLPTGELALGCAAGEGWAAVATRYVPVDTFCQYTASNSL